MIAPIPTPNPRVVCLFCARDVVCSLIGGSITCQCCCCLFFGFCWKTLCCLNFFPTWNRTVSGMFSSLPTDQTTARWRHCSVFSMTCWLLAILIRFFFQTASWFKCRLRHNRSWYFAESPQTRVWNSGNNTFVLWIVREGKSANRLCPWSWFWSFPLNLRCTPGHSSWACSIHAIHTASVWHQWSSLCSITCLLTTQNGTSPLIVLVSVVCSLLCLSLIHIWRCRRTPRCRSRWSPYH